MVKDKDSNLAFYLTYELAAFILCFGVIYFLARMTLEKYISYSKYSIMFTSLLTITVIAQMLHMVVRDTVNHVDQNDNIN